MASDVLLVNAWVSLLQKRRTLLAILDFGALAALSSDAELLRKNENMWRHCAHRH